MVTPTKMATAENLSILSKLCHRLQKDEGRLRTFDA